MIPKPFIADWRKHAPWKRYAQVEQDLIICRAVIAIFSDDFLKEHLAFRGGTALHKLYLHPAPRYSEDIDLVQVKAGPIKPIMQRLREAIDFFEEDRSTKVGRQSAKALYRFTSEYEGIRLRLKIEINCQEHFHVLDWVEYPFSLQSDWFSGEALVRTYDVHELLGTKLRALYQRRKGRDLFDLDFARRKMALDYEKIVACYRQYMNFSKGISPSRKEFLHNLAEKAEDEDFNGDMEGLLRKGVAYDFSQAMAWVSEELVEKHL
jgi:predicted nucleotidyltransferase component of viral defense system